MKKEEEMKLNAFFGKASGCYILCTFKVVLVTHSFNAEKEDLFEGDSWMKAHNKMQQKDSTSGLLWTYVVLKQRNIYL